VRFIDNFSSGGRGAASVEYLLEQGYAVIFLHREGSLKPFERQITAAAAAAAAGGGGGGGGGGVLDMLASSVSDFRVEAVPGAVPTLRPLVLRYHQAKTDRALLSVPYTSVFQYLQLLRVLCHEIGACGPCAMAGLYEFNPLDPRDESTRFQPLNPSNDKQVSKFAFKCNLYPCAMVYLAAAVSDFYVPWDQLPEHKIQSRAAAAVGLYKLLHSFN
jgi:phosphopantothenate-cysteine ligase